jgi:hypothetical protein
VQGAPGATDGGGLVTVEDSSAATPDQGTTLRNRKRSERHGRCVFGISLSVAAVTKDAGENQALRSMT